MISYFFIQLVYYFIFLITSLIGLLDDVTLNASIASSIAAIKPYYMALEPVFPVSTLIIILGVELTFEAAYFGYKGLRWAYQKVPGIN